MSGEAGRFVNEGENPFCQPLALTMLHSPSHMMGSSIAPEVTRSGLDRERDIGAGEKDAGGGAMEGGRARKFVRTSHAQRHCQASHCKFQRPTA